MLKKTKIAAALMLAAAGSANAAYMNMDGTGQVVLLPYYNVNNNFITNISITNTTGMYKAVKVRFRESRNSSDVLDFNLYMSPFDIWTAGIRMNPSTNLANIITGDETCTFPDKALLQAGVDFRNIYDSVTDEDVTEGYVEIIDMGDIADGTGPALDSNEIAQIGGDLNWDAVDTAGGERSIIAGLKHDSDGMPADCSVVKDAWEAGVANINPIGGGTPGGFTRGMLPAGIAGEGVANVAYDLDGRNNGMVAPSGGISAYAILINVETSAAFVEQGAAVNGYATLPQHYRSDDNDYYLLPALASGDVIHADIRNANADANVDGVNTQAYVGIPTVFDTGALNDIAPNPRIPMGANPMPMAYALSATAVASPYFVNPAINGATDIVVTFPMRKHGIYNGATVHQKADPTPAACNPADVTNTLTGTVYGLWTGGSPLGTDTVCTNANYLAGTPDVQVGLNYFDSEEREAAVAPGGQDFSPVPINAPTVVALQREVNVITVQDSAGSATSVLGTPDANVFKWTLDPGFTSGWVNITFDPTLYNYSTNTSIAELLGTSSMADDDTIGGNSGVDLNGVPVLGFTAMQADFGPGKVGETIDHVRTVDRTP